MIKRKNCEDEESGVVINANDQEMIKFLDAMKEEQEEKKIWDLEIQYRTR